MLVLASRSPQRSAILDQLGVEFRVEATDVDELTEGEPRELVLENARRKAHAIEADRVLGADTAVVLGDRVFGKPADASEAKEFLRALSGRSHEVHGGICLVDRGEERTAHAITKVRFRDLEAADLDWYLASEEWRERAGAYAIQGKGAALVEGIDGDYWNVVGLSVSALVGLAPAIRL